MSGKLGDLSRFTSQAAGIHHKQNNRPTRRQMNIKP